MKYSVSLQDICLQTFPCHTDSVWDLKLHNTTVVKDLNYKNYKNYKTIKYFPCQATAGLDGAVILYDFVSDYELRVRCYIQVRILIFISSIFYISSISSIPMNGVENPWGRSPVTC